MIKKVMKKVRSGKTDVPPVFDGHAPATATNALGATSGSVTPSQRNVTVIYTSNPAFATPARKKRIAKTSFASTKKFATPAQKKRIAKTSFPSTKKKNSEKKYKLGEKNRTAPPSSPGVRQ